MIKSTLGVSLGVSLGVVVSFTALRQIYTTIQYWWLWRKEVRLPKRGRKVAVVTGANKGIGKEVVRRLAGLLGESSTVVLTARSEDLGNKAVLELQQHASPKDAKIVYHQLDITQETSIQTLSEYLRTKYGKIDILVNNAAFAYKMVDKTPFPKQARDTISINYNGTLNVTTELLPLMNSGGRIINISSMTGKIPKGMPVDLKTQILDPNLTVEGLSLLMEQFVSLAQLGKHKDAGWPGSAYGTSKMGITQLSRVLSQEHPNLHVVACCPGMCRTDSLSSKSIYGWIFWGLSFILGNSAWEGADTPAWLAAVLTDKEIVPFNGKYVTSRKVKDY